MQREKLKLTQLDALCCIHAFIHLKQINNIGLSANCPWLYWHGKSHTIFLSLSVARTHTHLYMNVHMRHIQLQNVQCYTNVDR